MGLPVMNTSLDSPEHQRPARDDGLIVFDESLKIALRVVSGNW